MYILTFSVPAIVVGAIAYLLINRMLKEETIRRTFDIRKANIKTLSPIRLRAYERMALFLERIQPNSLLMRQQLRNVTAIQLQATLLKQLRQEWEHNVSQQIYIGGDTWTMLLNAKENIVQLVNTCASRLKPETSAETYARIMIEAYKTLDETPIDIAMNMLKSEVGNIG